MKFRSYLLKRKIEDLLMLPIILGGKFNPSSRRSKEYDIYFFFPFYHTGGAEKIHAQIAKAVGKTKKCIVFFTRKSVDERFLQEFKDSGCEIRDISRYTDNKLLYASNIYWRGKISNMINTQAKKPVVFNGQCNFGYKISPWIHKDIKQVELIHSFNTFSRIRLPFLPFITKTIMISRLRIEEHLQQYKKLEVPVEYAKKIQFIQNAIELPSAPCNKNFSGSIKILFVGRGTPEKRPGLFIDIAKAALRSGIKASFTLVGEMEATITGDIPSNTKAIGNINDALVLHQLYCEHHILIIPSATEGFPIVLMEAMARGCAVMATPVGDIPYHINEQNGFLFSSTDSTVVVNEAVEWLKQLSDESLQQRSVTAKEYAFRNFGIETFNQQYKAILQP
jgi:glycosyltransferase involved in cell wall biosynthesis